MISTPLTGGRRLFQSFKFNFGRQFQKQNLSTNSTVISVEKKRLEAEIKSAEESTAAPSFLPPADFQYNYEPMSIFEEAIGKHSVFIFKSNNITLYSR